MGILGDRTERNKLRQTLMKAEDKEIITREEVGFVVTLVERFRVDIDKKIKQMNVIQGELGQLHANETIIMNLIDSMVKAAERDLARQDTMRRIKEAKEEAIEAEQQEATDDASEEKE